MHNPRRFADAQGRRFSQHPRSDRLSFTYATISAFREAGLREGDLVRIEAQGRGRVTIARVDDLLDEYVHPAVEAVLCADAAWPKVPGLHCRVELVGA